MSEARFNEERLEHLKRVIAEDVDAGRYYGAVIAVARGGRLGIHEAIGHGDAARRQPLRLDSVFSIFSVTKAITNVLVLRSMELGRFALTTRISELVPEFSGGVRNQITIFHLLTHTSGLPIVFAIKPDMFIDRFDEMVAAVCANIVPAEPPG
jgi:CubicO group peptidase (beta-lactamase class C family)